MRMGKVFYSLMIRIVKLPGVRRLCRFLYDKMCSKRSLTFASDATVSFFPAPASGRALWPENNKPSWGEDQYGLSVIVPFYKTEKYARECIESILSQETSYDFEMICVDDGSPDGCPQIIDSYAQHPNVNVIHQPNSGVSAARNAGICAAKGSYILFFDSDDILCPGAIQAMMDAAVSTQAYIVDGAFRTMTDNGIPKRLYPRTGKVGRYGEGMSGYVAGKLYKKTLFQQICFPQGFWFEDTIIAALLFPLSPVTTTIQKEVFLYRTTPTGATLGNVGNPKCIDSLYILDIVIDACKTLGISISNNSMLWQAGPYLYGRIHDLPRSAVMEAFVLAADFMQRNHLLDTSIHGSFYEKALREAFLHKQFSRWKWASILM